MPDEKKPKGRVIWHGFVPDDDPIYRRAGWNFLVGTNLNPRPSTRKERSDEKKDADE